MHTFQADPSLNTYPFDTDLEKGGIYIHIPFCKQACHYCDFHFSTSLKKKDSVLKALQKELFLRRKELDPFKVETIYFGGGTPSLLSNKEIKDFLDFIKANYHVSANAEITLEANPDDLNPERIGLLPDAGVNRLSIGIQSFFDDDLKLMNRAHNAAEARKCLEAASRYFENLTVDLIYGIPGLTMAKWEQNIQTVLEYGIPHVSSYALTVEPKTALEKLIRDGKIPEVSDELAFQHFDMLVEKLQVNGFVHYELSNFGKPGYFSKNNSAYWQGKKYLGIGPSAHSFDGKVRSWNVANNTQYLKALEKEQLPSEKETLSLADRYNEAVMTGLRTMWGISLKDVEQKFGKEVKEYLMQQAAKFIEKGLLELTENSLVPQRNALFLKATPKGKFLTDGIASDLFLLNLK